MDTKETSTTNGPHSTRTGFVSRCRLACRMVALFGGEASNSFVVHGKLMFNHVLNVPASEEVWPGDAAELFFREFFAVRLVGDNVVYRNPGPIGQHMRDEILRMSDAWFHSHEAKYTAYYRMHRYMIESLTDPYISDQPLPGEMGWFEGLSDDEDYEFNTLNSELLLTEEYLPHASSNGWGAPDVVSSSNELEVSSAKPHRRVGLIEQPTEQEE